MKYVDEELFLRGIAMWCLYSLVGTFFAPQLEFLAGLLGTVLFIISLKDVKQKEPKLESVKNRLKFMTYVIVGIAVIDFILGRISMQNISTREISAIITSVEVAVGLYVLRLGIEMLGIEASTTSNALQINKLQSAWSTSAIVMASVYSFYFIMLFIMGNFALIILMQGLVNVSYALIKISFLILFRQELKTKK